MSNQTILIQYLTQQLAGMHDKLPLWASEAGALIELGINAERTGVQADPRTKQRAIILIAQLETSKETLDALETQVGEERLLSELRILRSGLEAATAQASLAGQRLHVQP